MRDQINEIAEFNNIGELEDPTNTELTLDLQSGESVNVIITKHFNAYDDPQAQKYKVEANEQTLYLFFEDLQVRLAKEDADGLPLGPKRTVVQITIHDE